MRRVLGPLLLALCWADGVVAGEGTYEINQACAQQTGCFPGDLAGFPVTITRTGSYRFTGDLDLPLHDVGLDLQAEGLTIDLNGFSIRSAYRCEPAACPGTGGGIGIIRNPGDSSWGRRVKVVNGQIIGMSGISLDLGNDAHVEAVVVSHAGLRAIEVGEGSVVLANRVSNVHSRGIVMGRGTVYAHNTVRRVGLGGVAGFTQAMLGGTATAGNYCDDGTCSRRGERRFYLTKSTHDGLQASSACDDGFHVAMFWEIFDPTHLSYDPTRGMVPPYDPIGPPIGSTTFGWVQTGFHLTGGPYQTGAATCTGYSTNASTLRGTTVTLFDDFDEVDFDPPDTIAPWNASNPSCNTAHRVWCVED
jgi:hypothetical protein